MHPDRSWDSVGTIKRCSWWISTLTLTRRFLWLRYCNIGGIFYTYVNQYDLFMADEAEMRALGR